MNLKRKSLFASITLANVLALIPVLQSAEVTEKVEKAEKTTATVEKPAEKVEKATEKKAKNLDWLVKHPTIIKLLELQNQERARNGVLPSKLNPEMCLAAQRHAVWMAETGAFTHSGLPYRENIFWGVRTPEEAINGWIWSPGHHTNMLSGTEVGFGYMIRDGRPYWCSVMQ